MSRPFVLALLGALLAAATLVSMRSAGEQAKADPADSAPVVRAPAPKAGAAKTTPSNAAPPRTPAKAKPAADPGIPPKVKRALDAKRTVVLFFRQRGADDTATASAVASLRGMKRVSVFSDDISKLARYRRVIADLGVTQAPSVVIVDKDRTATLFEGFVDAGTLKQRARDAR